MNRQNGLGLAAPQVGVSKRVVLVSVPEQGFNEVLVNPKIVSHSSDSEEMIEGCLSFPNIFIKVKRWKSINIIYQNLEGKVCHYRSTSSLVSQCIQHEIDHLDGVLFIDKFSNQS